MLSPWLWQLLGAALCLGAQAGCWVAGGSLLQPWDPAKQAWDPGPALLPQWGEPTHAGATPGCARTGLEPREPPPSPEELLPISDLILTLLATKQLLTEEASSP